MTHLPYFLVLLSITLSALAQDVPITKNLIDRLNQTELINNDEVIANLKIPRRGIASPSKFIVSNPYEPALIKKLEESDHPVEINGIKNYKKMVSGKVKFFHQDVVHQWHNVQNPDIRKNEVCGYKFVDLEKKKYVLKSFPHKDNAVHEGYTVTHQYHCGACSSLKDLAVYLEKRSLTVPARICSKKLLVENSKECYMKSIGFSETCAEAWAYNSQNTRKACAKICIKDYGLLNTLLNKFPDELNNPDGSLKPCIQCDELRSVPGYKYAGGRSRRGSGIDADSVRDPNDMYYIDYRTYYDEFGMQAPK